MSREIRTKEERDRAATERIADYEAAERRSRIAGRIIVWGVIALILYMIYLWARYA
jgi:hypothetical protein